MPQDLCYLSLMIIDFDTRTAWTEICEGLTDEFGFDGDSVSVKAYQGLYHGLAELTRGLARQFPTKKEIFFLGKVDPTIEPHAMALAKEGYKLTVISRDQLTRPAETVEAMSRETLCVLVSKEDPVFGLNLGADAFIEKVTEKKVFCIEVSHGSQIYKECPKSIGRPNALLHSFGRGKALGFLGARYKFGAFMSEGLNWDKSSFAGLRGLYAQTLDEDLVKSLEANPPLGAKAIFQDRNRVLDRACLFWEDIDGSAMLELLSEKLELASADKQQLATLSLSTWGGVRTMTWLEGFDLTPNQVRGSLLISNTLIQKNGESLKSLIEDCYKEILKLQSGD